MKSDRRSRGIPRTVGVFVGSRSNSGRPLGTDRRAPPDAGTRTLARSTIGAFNAETTPLGLDSDLPRKEVIQPHLPVRLPCYDFVPITDPTFDGCLLAVGPPASGVVGFHDVTGGVYKAREHIHRRMLTGGY